MEENSNRHADLIQETDLNWVSPATEIEGSIIVHDQLRVFGKIRGSLKGLPGSRITLMAGSRVEGEIEADEIWINGFVQAHVVAHGKATLSQNATVLGSVTAAQLKIEHGAQIEGPLQSHQSVST